MGVGWLGCMSRAWGVPCPGATCLRRACSYLLVHVWVDVCGASTELYDVGVWHDDTQYDEDVPRDHERGGVHDCNGWWSHNGASWAAHR